MARVTATTRALVVRLAAVLVVVSACSGNGHVTPVVVAAPEDDSGEASALPVRAGTWRPLPPSPLSARWDATGVWTGSKVVVWGGHASAVEALVDGASYDPQSRSWTPIPPAPVPERGHQLAYWIDDRLLVWVDAWHPELAAGAVYTAEDHRWVRLASPPDALTLGAPAVATEDLLFVVARSEDGPTSVLSYDPATDHWDVLPAPPPTTEDVFIVETGGELYLWGCAGRYGAAYDSARGEWTGVKPPPGGSAPCYSSPPLFPAAFASDQAVVVWPWRDADRPGEQPAPRLPGARFDRGAETWTASAPAPTDMPARAVATGDAVVVWGGGTHPDPPCGDFEYLATTAAGFSYSIAGDSWQSLDEAPLAPRNGHAMVWTDRDVFVWGGAASGPAGQCVLFGDGATWEPLNPR